MRTRHRNYLFIPYNYIGLLGVHCTIKHYVVSVVSFDDILFCMPLLKMRIFFPWFVIRAFWDHEQRLLTIVLIQSIRSLEGVHNEAQFMFQILLTWSLADL